MANFYNPLEEGARAGEGVSGGGDGNEMTSLGYLGKGSEGGGEGNVVGDVGEGGMGFSRLALQDVDDIREMEIRVCNTSLGGNGLKTHVVYKFEFNLEVAGQKENKFRWFVQKRHKDFEELVSKIGKEGGATLANGLGKLPKHETVLSLYTGGVSKNILKRCRKLCTYLRNMVKSEARDLRCVRDFLGMAGTDIIGQEGVKNVLREGYVEVCVNSVNLKDVTYYKRRYGILKGGEGAALSLHMYKHHDDDKANFVSWLGGDGGTLKAEGMGGGGKGYAYWRIWVEGDGGRGGEGGNSYMFRGTEKMRQLWLEAAARE